MTSRRKAMINRLHDAGLVTDGDADFLTDLGGTSPLTFAQSFGTGGRGGTVTALRQNITGGANQDYDQTLAHGAFIIDVYVYLHAAGTAGSTIQLKKGTTTVSDAIDVSAGLQFDVFRAGQIDYIDRNFVAGDTIRLTIASTGGDFPAADVIVTAIRFN